MARISGVDLPRDKRVEIGLTYIFGIGRKTATEILAATGVSPLWTGAAASAIMERRANSLPASPISFHVGLAQSQLAVWLFVERRSAPKVDTNTGRPSC